MKLIIKYSLLVLFWVGSIHITFAQCWFSSLTSELSDGTENFKSFVKNNESSYKSYQLLYTEAPELKTDITELTLVANNLEKIEDVGGYIKWKDINNAGGGLRNTIKYVDNYRVTSTGRIAEFVSESGDVLGTLFKQSKNGKLSYSFKYKTPSGNVKTLNKLEAEIYDDFIEFDFNVPAELKGKGISSVVFDDAIKYYDAKNLPYKGIRGRWEGADPKYTDGISDNFKAFKEAKKANKTETEAAFETWTGKQADKAGFTKATVTTDDDVLILVEFTK